MCIVLFLLLNSFFFLDNEGEWDQSWNLKREKKILKMQLQKLWRTLVAHLKVRMREKLNATISVRSKCVWTSELITSIFSLHALLIENVIIIWCVVLFNLHLFIVFFVVISYLSCVWFFSNSIWWLNWC